MEDISDAVYIHAETIWKDFKIKNLGDYHDLYVQSNTLLLVDVFENFQDMYLEIYEFDFAHFLTGPGFPWQVALKKSKLKLDVLIDIDMFSNGRKRNQRRNLSCCSSICKS